MANHSQRRLLLSLRQPFHLYRQLNSSIHRSTSHNPQFRNPNFRPLPFSSTSILPKLPTLFKSSKLIPLSFGNSFNGVRTFATRLSESSSNSSRPPKDVIMLEGCDFEHWLVVVEPPDPQLTRDDIIDGYIKTLAHVIGSEEEARMKIYSVSTRHYFAFSAVMSEELGYKLKELPNVRWVLPDSYMNVKDKTYAGEPFINGQAVPYDPKYHETWVRNNEESHKNNNKGRRRQRDPNSQSRSPTSSSTSSSSNQKLMSASDSQPSKAPQTSAFQDQTPQPSTPSRPGSHQQNWMHPAESMNEFAQSSRTQNPSCVQSDAQTQTPPSLPQNHAHQPSYTQNYSTHWTSSPPQPPPTTPNSQGWNSHNHNWEPTRGYENHAQHPSHVQNQTPSLSPTSNPYDPARNDKSWGATTTYHSQPPRGFESQARYLPSHVQNQTPSPSPTCTVQNKNWGATTYQSQPPQPPISNNFQYDNMPPSSPSGNVPYQGQSWAPAAGYQSQPPQSPISNNFQYDNMPPSSTSGNVPYQGQSWAPAAGYQGQSPPPPISNSISHANVPPSAPARGVPTHMQNTNFHGGSMPSQVQLDGYPYSDKRHHNQSGVFSNSYPSQSLQQQHYQDSNSGYSDVQSSSFVVTPPNAQNFQNAPRWDMPGEAQRKSYSRNIPNHVQNVGGTDYPPEPPHPSQSQHYQNNSSNLQNSNLTPSHQGWHHQNKHSSIQNSISPNMPMSHGMQSHQFQGNRMPRPQNNEFQHNIEPTARIVNYNGGRMPNNASMENVQTRDYQESDIPCTETVQTRDYQERDIPIDKYMYASK